MATSGNFYRQVSTVTFLVTMKPISDDMNSPRPTIKFGY